MWGELDQITLYEIRVSVALMKHYDEKQFWEKRVCLACTSLPRNLQAQADAEALEECSILVCSC